MAKQISLSCPASVQELLIRIIRNYTDVAFPAGGSDCALVAREELLRTVKLIETAFHDDEAATYSKRLRAMFKEGIKLHYQLIEAEQQVCVDQQRENLLALVTGIELSSSTWEQAISADRNAPNTN